MIAGTHEDWELSAQLLAAGERSRHRTPNTAALLHDQFTDRVQAALGAERSDQLFAEGRAMPLAEARAAALL